MRGIGGKAAGPFRTWLLALGLGALGLWSVASGKPIDSARGAIKGAAEQRYVVVLENSAGRPGAVAKRHTQQREIELERVFTKSLDGYAATMTATEAEAIARRPEVAAVGLDPVGEPAAQWIPSQLRRIFAADRGPAEGHGCLPGYDPGVNPSIDIDCTDEVRVDVDIAVLDTPINPATTELNLVSSVDCFGNDPTPEDDDPSDHTGCDPGGGDAGIDCNGAEAHGETISAPMAGIDNGTGMVGVAPGARIWSVGVADKINGGPSDCGPFYLSDVIAGVEWITARANQIEVANMSMQFDVPGPGDPAGQALDQALEDAIDDSINAGVVYVAAAGNEGDDLTNYLPAKYERVITTTAVYDSDGEPDGIGDDSSEPEALEACNTETTDYDDTNANATNYGPAATTTWGPGADIAAVGPCTSIAAAIVSGAAALLASKDNPNNAADVGEIRDTLVGTANPANKAGGGYDDETATTREPLLDVSDDEVFAPKMLSSFWAYNPDYAGRCPKVSKVGNTVTGGCLIEDFQGSFNIFAYIPHPYLVGNYAATFDLVIDSTGAGYAVNPTVSATGAWLLRVACDDADTTIRPWPVNSYVIGYTQFKIDVLVGLRAGAGSPGDSCTQQVITVDATQIGWGDTELEQMAPAPNISDGHWESDNTTWVVW